jgi:DNA-binding protein HU-beta
MNNKELISNIAAKMQLPKKEVEEMLDATVSVFVSELADGKTIGIHGFGQLEVKKREERFFGCFPKCEIYNRLSD